MTFTRFGLALAMLILWACEPAADRAQVEAEGQVRTYYIAADVVVWDYAPSNRNLIFDKEFDEKEAHFVKAGDYRAGKVFKKALYREYTDETFTILKPRAVDWEHLGFLGPLIRAEVGDTIKIVFRNNVHFPASMHPHGVFYEKDSEGALYADGTEGKDKVDDGVPTGGTHVYTWEVRERAGPPPGGGSTAFWMYHSHVNEEMDFSAGLVGPMIITAKGMTGEGLRPSDVDREFVVAFMTTEEMSSWYFEENLETYAAKANEVTLGIDVFGTRLAQAPDGFIYMPFMESINGFLYGNGPVMTAKKGERVRWYVMAGTSFEVHAPHWHGNVGTVGKMRMDVLELTTMGMQTLDMIPDAAGKWLFHCHVMNHFAAGMGTFYEILEE